MTHTVAVGEFEGPLGLLLDLVEQHKIEVSSISVTEITARYLERIRSYATTSAPEELSEFLELGARLLYIKSLALLPQESRVEQAEELRKLNLELEEYRQMKAAARELSKRTRYRTWTRSRVERLSPQDLPFPEFDLAKLRDAFNRALKYSEPAKRVTVLKRQLKLDDIIKKLTLKLDQKPLQLQDVLDECADRLEIIVTFLALLELLRAGAARVRQLSQFGPITIESTHA